MKTMLRIGLILVGVLTMWVACFAKAPSMSFSKSPEIAADMPAEEVASAELAVLRDSFVARIKGEGVHPSLPAPQIVVDNPLAFANYESGKNAIHVAAWEKLLPEQRAIFSQLASATTTKMSSEATFTVALRWIFTHEMGHWWQECQQRINGESHYAVERGANRIALAYWRLQDPKVLDWVAEAAAAQKGALPNPVPEGQSVAAYFDANYETLKEPAYLWYQNRMILEILDEKPPLSFRETLRQPVFPPPDEPKIAPEMQTLTKTLSGVWSLNVTFEPSPEAPNGFVNTGEETWRAGPGGYTLLEEEHLRLPGGDAFLLGTIWWNKGTKTLQGMECQNLLPYTCDVKGAQNDITMSWDGKQYVIDEIETSKSGQKSLWHEVWADITPTSFTQTGEYGPPGGERKRLFTIHATKVGAASKTETMELNAESHPDSHTKAPAPEIQSLAKMLAGNWSTTYEFAPGGMSPTGGRGTGEEAWRIGPGGYVLTEEEHVHAPFGEMYLIAFHWWDKNTNSLRGMLCNNSGPAACDFNTYSNSSLKWDGRQLTIDMGFPQGGKKMLWHEVWSGITASSFTQTGEMGEVGGPLKRAVTIHGTKVTEVVKSAFAGTWRTENPAPTPGTITYSKSSTGGEHYSNNRNSEYDFAIDGKEYPTDRPASTVAWTSAGSSSWDCVEKIRDKVTRKVHLTLSDAGQTLTTTYTWFNPANRTANGSSVYARVSGGPGLEGSWKMTKRTEEQPDTMTIAFPAPGQMYIYVDPIDNTWAGPTDGTFMAVQSPLSPPGMTTAFRIAGPRKMTSETRLGDKTLYLATFEVSEDGNTLTRTTWPPAKEHQKRALILKRQN